MIGSQEPDILLFTEVIPKAQQKPIDESQLNVNGYNLYCNFDNTKDNLGTSGIRGVAIYIKENFISKEVKLTTTFEDHVWVEIKLTNNEILLCARNKLQHRCHLHGFRQSFRSRLACQTSPENQKRWNCR